MVISIQATFIITRLPIPNRPIMKEDTPYYLADEPLEKAIFKAESLKESPFCHQTW